MVNGQLGNIIGEWLHNYIRSIKKMQSSSINRISREIKINLIYEFIEYYTSNKT